MIYIYLACLIIGGILLGGSLFLGMIHADADADHDADTGGDIDADADHDGEAGHDVDAAGIWLPFLSIRFWVFTFCFFGLCGTLLTMIGTNSVVAAIVSVVIGLTCGTGAAYVIHRLGRMDATGDVATESEFLGASGVVLVSLKEGKRGKVRLTVRGQSVDLVARSSDGEDLPVNMKVLVVDYNDDMVSVIAAPEVTSG